LLFQLLDLRCLYILNATIANLLDPACIRTHQN
jgi:hypothetical protein